MYYIVGNHCSLFQVCNQRKAWRLASEDFVTSDDKAAANLEIW